MKEIIYNIGGSVSNFKLGAFATGSYHNKCVECGSEFIGDKRASTCLSCEIKKHNLLVDSQQFMTELPNILSKVDVVKKILTDFGHAAEYLRTNGLSDEYFEKEAEFLKKEIPHLKQIRPEECKRRWE